MAYVIDKEAKCAVVGYGSWATALVKILLENEAEVRWHIRDREVIEHIRREHTNPRYLRDVHFNPERLKMSDDIDEVVRDAGIVILAMPSVYMQDTLSKLTVPLNEKFVVSAIKGIVPGRLVTIAEYLNSDYGVPFAQIGIITGPCHAEEVALERLSYLTVVCKDECNSHLLEAKLRTSYIMTTCSSDIYGTEYASVLKNIYAIAVGICHGLGYGDNFMAVITSNGAMEMSRFMDETYPSPRNTFASAYLGDLIVTAYSQFSRNRTFGMMIGKGYPVRTAQMEMNMVAEGYYASECIHSLNERFGVDMPIAGAVYDILYRNKPARKTIAELTKKLI